MKTITTALANLLATRQFCYASLFQFNLPDGVSLYFTSHVNNISWNGNVYQGGGTTGPYFDQEGSKAKLTQATGLTAQQLQVTVIPAVGLIEGEPFMSAVRQGVFDGADLIYSGAYWAQGTVDTPLNPVTPVGTVIKMVGRIAEIDVGRSSLTITANDHLELLNQQMPRNMYQPGCLNTLFDTACSLNMAAFAVTGSIIGAGSANIIYANLSQATQYFDLGIMKFTSGANAGVSRSVKTYTQGSPCTISMALPFPVIPSAGDDFTIYPGCNKSQTTCQGKFNNLIHFRGFPYIPVPDTAV